MLAVPLDEVVILDARFLHRRPDLDGPEKLPEVLVDPVEAARDHLLRVVLEVVEDGDVRIARELGRLLAEELVEPQVLGRHVLVGLAREGPQDDAAVRVEAHAGADVRVLHDEVDHRAHLGLRGRIGAGAQLLEFLPPSRGKVAVEVEPLLVAVDADLDAVVVAERSLGNDAPVGAAVFRRPARRHEARVIGMRLVAAIGIGDAHGEYASVAVDVFHVEAVDRLLVEGIGPRRGADVLRPVGERPFGAVGIDARAHVDRARVHEPRDVRVLAVTLLERVQVMQAGGRSGELRGVDVAVDPEGGLVGGRARVRVGRRDDPDVAALVARAHALHGKKPRMARREALQQRGEVVVAVETVEAEFQNAKGAGAKAPSLYELRRAATRPRGGRRSATR